MYLKQFCRNDCQKNLNTKISLSQKNKILLNIPRYTLKIPFMFNLENKTILYKNLNANIPLMTLTFFLIHLSPNNSSKVLSNNS